METKIYARASHRIELAGDWGDLPGFCWRYGGRMVNLAITIPDFVIEVCASRISSANIEAVSKDGNAFEVITTADQLVRDAATNPLFLTKVVLKDLIESTGYGNDLCSFLVHRIGTGIRVETNSTAPAGSGLGTSSILAATIRSAVSRLIGEPLSPLDTCWRTFLMESALGLGSGWQDQVGGVFPGFKDIVYERSDRLNVTQITPPIRLLEELSALSVLGYTGRTRFSGSILNAVCADLDDGGRPVQIVTALQGFCQPVLEALRGGDYAALGSVATQITELEKELHPGIVPPHVGVLFEATSAYCHGSRICGAGGEGFLVFFTKGEEEKRLVTELLTNAGLTCYSMSIGHGLIFSQGDAPEALNAPR